MKTEEYVCRGPGYWDGSDRPHNFHTVTTDTGDKIEVRDTEYSPMPNYPNDTKSTPQKKKKKVKPKKKIVQKEEKYVSLSICGHCKRDTKDDFRENRTEKVIEYDFADMLCGDCRRKMRNEMVFIAMKYLDNK